jgi:hypothetical protein
VRTSGSTCEVAMPGGNVDHFFINKLINLVFESLIDRPQSFLKCVSIGEGDAG